jgi:cell division protein ZapA (FtsZ GTPase activity inhibitor)
LGNLLVHNELQQRNSFSVFIIGQIRKFSQCNDDDDPMTTVIVTIDGRQFRLRCDNHERTLRAAKEIDRLLDVLRQNSTDQSTMTLAILAALNVAERHDWLSEHHRKTVDYLCQELRAMHLHIEQSIAEAVAAAA